MKKPTSTTMKKPKFTLQFYNNFSTWTPFYNKYFRWLPYIKRGELMWKDKFNTPRCEREPYFRVEWLWFGVYGAWGDDQYWEQWLWIYEYNNGDYQKAKETWEWETMEGESTWVDY